MKKIPLDYSLEISLGLLQYDMGWFGFSQDCVIESVEHCLADEQLLLAFLHIPMCPLSSDHLVIVLDQNFMRYFLWFLFTMTP